MTAVRRLLPLLAGLLLPLVLLVASCSSDGPAMPTDPMLAAGQTVYKDNCASCHGQSGGGGIGSALAGEVEEKYPNVADHTAIVVNGVKNKNMPAFGERLTAEEIDAVVRYEREGL